MDLCNSEEPRWTSTSRAPTTSPTTMTPMSSPCGPTPVSVFLHLLYNALIATHLSTRLDLFADGDDFSWQTIQSGRNRYYQRQLANQIEIEDHSHPQSGHQCAESASERGPEHHHQHLRHLHLTRDSLTLGTLTQNCLSDRRCSHSATIHHANQRQQHTHLAASASPTFSLISPSLLTLM